MFCLCVCARYVAMTAIMKFSEGCEFETTYRGGTANWLFSSLIFHYQCDLIAILWWQGELIHGCETAQENGKENEEGGEKYDDGDVDYDGGDFDGDDGDDRVNGYEDDGDGCDGDDDDCVNGYDDFICFINDKGREEVS